MGVGLCVCDCVCVYVLCRPNGKLCSLSYRAKCSTTFTSICDDADCKLFTEFGEQFNAIFTADITTLCVFTERIFLG